MVRKEPLETRKALSLEVVNARSGSLREALVLTAPLAVSFVSFSLMGIVDTVIMGRVGTPEQGAVGLGSMLAWLMGSVFVGTVTVINTFVAQDFGAKKYRGLSRHVCTGLALIPAFTVAVWATIPAFPGLINLMGTSSEVAPHVEAYLCIRILSLPMLMANFVFVSFFRGIGNMRIGMVVSLIANAMNVPLTIVLVFGLLGFPRLGVAGAAFASVISCCAESLMYATVYLGSRHNDLYQTRTWSRPTLAELKKFLAIGFPIGFSWLFEVISWTLFSIYAASREPSGLAAHMIIFSVIHLSFLPAVAVAVAGMTLVGQYLGAERPDLAARSAWISMGLGVGYMTLAGVVMALVREPMIVAFNPDPAVLEVGLKIVIVAALFQPFDGVATVGGGVLRGAGDTRYPMLALLFCGMFVFVPGVYLLGEHANLGIVGAWIAALIYVLVLASLIAWRLRQGKWKKMRV